MSTLPIPRCTESSGISSALHSLLQEPFHWNACPLLNSKIPLSAPPQHTSRCSMCAGQATLTEKNFECTLLKWRSRRRGWELRTSRGKETESFTIELVGLLSIHSPHHRDHGRNSNHSFRSALRPLGRSNHSHLWLYTLVSALISSQSPACQSSAPFSGIQKSRSCTNRTTQGNNHVHSSLSSTERRKSPGLTKFLYSQTFFILTSEGCCGRWTTFNDRWKTFKIPVEIKNASSGRKNGSFLEGTLVIRLLLSGLTPTLQTPGSHLQASIHPSIIIAHSTPKVHSRLIPSSLIPGYKLGKFLKSGLDAVIFKPRKAKLPRDKYTTRHELNLWEGIQLLGKEGIQSHQNQNPDRKLKCKDRGKIHRNLTSVEKQPQQVKHGRSEQIKNAIEKKRSKFQHKKQKPATCD